MTGFLRVAYRLSYKLRSHHWSEWPLDYWLSLLIVLLAGAASLDWIPGAPWLVYVLAVLFVVFWGVTLLARRNQYVIFTPSPTSLLPDVGVLDPTDKIELRATGRFEVEGKGQTFTEIVAYFRSFATREHAVMAIVPPSRFLLVGSRPDGHAGMWYIFFQPRHIMRLQRGMLAFGRETRPAICVLCEGQEEGSEEVVYLSFNEEESLRRVLANLLYDARPEALVGMGG
jgi:hypothetical protein